MAKTTQTSDYRKDFVQPKVLRCIACFRRIGTWDKKLGWYRATVNSYFLGSLFPERTKTVEIPVGTCARCSLSLKHAMRGESFEDVRVSR